MLIQNGTIVNENRVFIGDILIQNGKISKIDKNILWEGKKIDATGKYVVPGGVDAHTHFDLDVSISRATDDFYTGSVAAACGGTTTVIDHMAFGPAGCSLKHQVEQYHKLADDKCVIDYGFHGVIQHVDKNILGEMETLIEHGITSYKLYMTYDYKLSDIDILAVMDRIKELELIITVHPENDGVVNYFKKQYKEKGLLTPEYHGKSRPYQCEGEAINRLILFSQMLGDVPLYIVHLSNAMGLDYIRDGRKRGLKHLFAETCPQYLYLDESLYKNEDGLKYIMSPPLRDKVNNDILWNGIKDNSIQTIATDHCPFNYNKEKQMGKEDFTKCPNGAPGVELRMPLMFSSVLKNNISPKRFVEICCTNPAKLFGIYPQKGTIKEGSDGDVVIINPDKSGIISHDKLHENVDYTPFEGIEVLGEIEYTISRGEIIVENNKYISEKGRGLYLKRNKPLLEL